MLKPVNPINGSWFDIAEALARRPMLRTDLKQTLEMSSGHLSNALHSMSVEGLVQIRGGVASITTYGRSRLAASDGWS